MSSGSFANRKGIANINTPASGFGVSLNNHGIVTVQSDMPLAALRGTRGAAP